ncbi:Putative carbonic anhydrase 5 [Toxocara canis]|uniref:Putative carbonic anhydrase 5 n=1 Tax=Toxocara canis TaxID=6265 RepID=A0A0B2VBI3_TOXCA|nr:Putative carbonic anhydrase 5 [Toxocara canis]
MRSLKQTVGLLNALLITVLFSSAYAVSTSQGVPTTPLKSKTAIGAPLWGYEDPNGPTNWPGVCIYGSEQSPINIDLATVVTHNFDQLIFLNYNSSGNVAVRNSGRTGKCLILLL